MVLSLAAEDLAAALAGWPANLTPEELREVQPSDVEMLLVSGNIDFLTPAQFATNELLPYLTRAYRSSLQIAPDPICKKHSCA